MNRFKVFFIAILSILMLLSSSPWEGAAATAPDGELPARGMFVATNSFPINTVVDITNIETNRSTRVIVAKGLDSPGLLAVVSREASELLGMRTGSISRVRMVQPSDPIAYLRFIEGQAEGIPAYDSGNVITEETYREELYANDTYRLQEVSPLEANDSNVPSPVTSGVMGPSYVLEPEWQNRREDIVDIAGYNDPVYEQPVIEEPVIEAEEEYIAESYSEDYDDYFDYEDEPEYIAEEPYDEAEYIEEYIAEDSYEDYSEEEPEYLAEEAYDEAYEEEPEYLVEEAYEDYFEEEQEPEYLAEEAYNEFLEDIEYIVEEPYDEAEEEVEYVLVPADERPPESIYGIDPNEIIPEIAATPFVPPPSEPVRPSVDSAFSVPRVTELSRGSYYVQLAALDNPDLVENALSGIDRSYGPVVYKDGDHWYRILLGPMNQGESAAVLARFKSIGYRDAFVRHER